MLIPNIEFRVTPQTDRGHAINLHLLVDPTPEDHVEKIESALSRLSIRYDGDNYSCIPSEIRRLGTAFDKTALTDRRKLEVGTNQYKIDFSVFMQWFNAEQWLAKNSLIAISGGNQRTLGSKR